MYLYVSGRMESLQSLMVGCNSGLDLPVAGMVDLLTLSCQHSKYVQDAFITVSERHVFDGERVGTTLEIPLSSFHDVSDLDLVHRTVMLELLQVLPCVGLLCKLELGR